VYASGLYSTQHDLHQVDVDGVRLHPEIPDPGPELEQGNLLQISHCTSGHESDLEIILGPADFPTHMRWSSPQMIPSPDGSKLFMYRENYRPEPAWTVNISNGSTGGTFQIFLGV